MNVLPSSLNHLPGPIELHPKRSPRKNHLRHPHRALLLVCIPGRHTPLSDPPEQGESHPFEPADPSVSTHLLCALSAASAAPDSRGTVRPPCGNPCGRNPGGEHSDGRQRSGTQSGRIFRPGPLVAVANGQFDRDCGPVGGELTGRDQSSHTPLLPLPIG